MTQLSEAEVRERLKDLSPEQVQELIKQQCIFCKIVAGEVPAYKVYEDNNFLAFLDVNPAHAGHTLVIPKPHVSVLPQIPDQMAAALLILIKSLAGNIFEATKAEGVNILQNNGQVAGQVVPHVHFHIIPRFPDDKVSLSWEPKKLTEEQFKDMQKKIVSSISGKPKSQKKEPPSKPKKSEPEKKPKKKLPRLKSRLP